MTRVHKTSELTHGLMPLPGMGLYMLRKEHLVFTEEDLVLTIPVGQVAGMIRIPTLSDMAQSYSSLSSRSSWSGRTQLNVHIIREGLELRLHSEVMIQQSIMYAVHYVARLTPDNV